VFSNGAAETLLNGRALAVRNGRLVCARPAENDALARAIAVGAVSGRETLGRQHVVNGCGRSCNRSSPRLKPAAKRT
jgi:hypothetical protein